ncbi:MAG: 3,4-dihydroxy-2-butanone-4-phosphate synthase [Alphaproteobacteria bacterium]|nr:3,4-dihydroxy-2-butanone-4-phosphate synthase [Alphaproteobacteria bacterium]
MFVLVDDEGRENEGDLVIPAQMATPDAINFMATHGRGLICLALTSERTRQLGLEPLDRRNPGPRDTAFTLPIEAREGVTTGISAADRARTIQVAIDPGCAADDLRTPGHVFPLAARDGGVLLRAGHTEAAVDLARLAGLVPAAVICEIMKADGTMARLDDLVPFVERHRLRLGAIEDLIAWRVRHDPIVTRVLESDFLSDGAGAFKLYIYRNTVLDVEHVALVKGGIDDGRPVPVRVHALDVLADVLGGGTDAAGLERAGTLRAAMRTVEALGRGVIVLIRESVTSGLARRLSVGEGPPGDLREHGVGAQILRDLGVRDMILLTHTQRPIVGLEGFDLRVVERRPPDEAT